MTYLANIPANVRNRAARNRLVALDVDGTLTDGRLRLASDGTEIKAFSALDGQGLKLLRDAGIEVALITARTSQIAGCQASAAWTSSRWRVPCANRSALRLARRASDTAALPWGQRI